MWLIIPRRFFRAIFARRVFRNARQVAFGTGEIAGALEARGAGLSAASSTTQAIASGVSAISGWAVGQLYTAKYFPPASKSKVEELVANLKLAMRALHREACLDGRCDQGGSAHKKLDTYQGKK